MYTTPPDRASRKNNQVWTDLYTEAPVEKQN